MKVLDWGDDGAWKTEEPLDVVIGSDLVYEKAIVPLLLKVGL